MAMSYGDFEGVAEGNGVGGRGVPVLEQASQGGTVWSDQPVQAGCCFRSGKIAEGKGRSTDRDRSLFFCHARGSLLELETQILIAKELAYLDRAASEQLRSRCGEVGQDAERLGPVSENLRPGCLRSGSGVRGPRCGVRFQASNSEASGKRSLLLERALERSSSI
jgi:four helix bundle protein